MIVRSQSACSSIFLASSKEVECPLAQICPIFEIYGNGGSVAGKSKAVVDIIHGIKENAGNIPVSIKISAGDMSPRDMLETCRLLVDAGISSIEYEGYYSDFVPILQQVLNVPVILTDGHRECDKLNLLLNQYGVEYFGMSRPLIREENLPNRWKEGDTRKAECVSCGMCMSTYGYRCALTPQKYGKLPRKFVSFG